jgi:Flp pilus assembly protein TadG
MGRRMTASWHRMMRNSRDASGEQGSTLVEFAMAFTILLTIMLGIMDFSRAMYAYHFLSNAAREATRYASVRGSSFATACTNPLPVAYNCKAATTDITAYVQSIVAPGVYESGGTANSSCGSPSVGQLNVCTTWSGTAPSGAAGACNTANGNNSPGCLVQVKVLYNYGFTLPFVSKNVSNITMTSTSETVIQQ